MKRHTLAAASLGALSLLLAWPELAGAEDYYRKTKGYRVEPEPDPPSYVRNLSKTQFEQFRDVDWLDVGLDFRTRYEYRENDLRPYTNASPNPSTKPATRFRDEPNDLWLLRTRAYLGVKDILDPLRFAVEFQDSRSYGDRYQTTSQDVNEFELLQGYGELYFDNALGQNRPISIRAGRQSLELLDRRLIANNQFRNTSNNFEGYRVRFGKKQNDWDLDTFALQPVERLKYDFDRPDERTWIYGAVLSLKQWSEFITFQPYFIGRKTKGDLNNINQNYQTNDMDIYAPGLRVYGVIPDTGFDFDADINKQFGRFGSGTKSSPFDAKNVQKMLQHDAIAYAGELGYTFDHDWKPRLSLFYGYGSGDKSSKDGVNQRFDAFYGFNQPWSRNDYFSWDNIHSPKVRIEFSPYTDVQLDAGYNAYWLASDTGGWNRAGLKNPDKTGSNFLGHEFDIRLRHKLNAYVDWSLSYAHFTPGDYTSAQNGVKQSGTDTYTACSAATANQCPFSSQDSNFFYFEVSLNAFGDGKPKRK